MSDAVDRARAAQIDALLEVLRGEAPYDRLPVCLTEGHRLIQNMATPDVVVGPRGFEALLRLGHAGLGDLVRCTELRGHDDAAHFARIELEATHRGPLGLIRPTGRRIMIRLNMVFTFEAERIAETWMLADTYAMLTALDAFEPVSLVRDTAS